MHFKLNVYVNKLFKEGDFMSFQQGDKVTIHSHTHPYNNLTLTFDKLFSSKYAHLKTSNGAIVTAKLADLKLSGVSNAGNNETKKEEKDETKTPKKKRGRPKKDKSD